MMKGTSDFVGAKRGAWWKMEFLHLPTDVCGSDRSFGSESDETGAKIAGQLPWCSRLFHNDCAWSKVAYGKILESRRG